MRGDRTLGRRIARRRDGSRVEEVCFICLFAFINFRATTVIYCPAHAEEVFKWNSGHDGNFFLLRLRGARLPARGNYLEASVRMAAVRRFSQALPRGRRENGRLLFRAPMT